MKTYFHRIKQILPWLVAIGIFIYLFNKYPLNKVLISLSYVNLLPFIAFSLAYFFIIYFTDSLVMTYVFKRFAYPVKLKDILLARGVTYLIMIVSYPASQVAFAYYLKRRYKIPILEALGIFMFILFIDLLWIVTLALGGSFFQEHIIAGVDLGHLVLVCALILYLFAFLWIGFWGRWFDKISTKLFTCDFIEKQRKRQIFNIFEKTRFFDYVRVGLMRIPIHFTIIISVYILLLTFNTSIPFTKILGNIPLVFFIGTLPITPGGLGTTNAAMVELLYKYISGPIFEAGLITPQDLIFAATLLWMFTNYLLKGIIGITMLRFASKDLFKATSENEEEKLEKETTPININC